MGRTHQSCQLPFFLSSLPNHLFYQKVVEVVIAWKGKSMGNFELGRAPSFGMSCFACMDKKTPQPYTSLTRAFTFWELRDILAHSPSSFSIRVEDLQHWSCYHVYPLRSTSFFPLERLWLMCFIVILNYRVYETLLLVFPSEVCTRLRNGRDVECAWKT